MEELTGKKYLTSIQHKEMELSRKKRDDENTLLVIEMLEQSNLFEECD